MLTILNIKDLDRCSASTVSLSIEEAISKNLLNLAQYQYWLTDNTAYMSESTAGAVVKFNQQYSAKATRISYSLHALYIASVHFNNTTFGKTKSLSGICLEPYLFNVFNLAYYLHCGYNKSDKDNPLNMKAEKISKLYKALLNYDLKRYQKPISTHWLYQLTMAKQYLNRRDIHLQFSKIQIMVSFGKWFYEKVIFFLIGKDTNTTNLPNGFRASKIPDKVEQWINDLQIASEYPDEVFVEEMLLAHETLSTDEFNDLINRIEYGLVKALDAFKRWMDL
ncbi:26579_t:CDS:2 [Racocetra persica]|uniref:26579_t:CDS:1 n=1 Tax=Racocetra persica TaxID=160502 RepID=A0ACA9QFW0_9GLOM|nr:26579_t:CDS:2 [Racocetra persica]